MVKNRMSAIDIGAVCAELRENCVGARLANVYDVSAKVDRPSENYTVLNEQCQ